MKLPFQTLAVLLLFVGAPLGLMRLTSEAIQTPETYPLISTSPQSGLAIYEATRHAFQQAIMPKKLVYLAFRDRIRSPVVAQKLVGLHDYLDSRRSKHFTYVSSGEHSIPGLVDSTRKALANSWEQWQPTLVALPDELRELRVLSLVKTWRNRANMYVGQAPTVTRSPLPAANPPLSWPGQDAVYDRYGPPIASVLYSTAKSIFSDSIRMTTFPAIRLVSRAMGEMPNPSVGVARMADGLHGWTGQAIEIFVRSRMDNR